MSLLAFPFFNFTIILLIILLCVISLLMIGLILLQKPKQEGMGAAFGGDTMSKLAGAKSADMLQKITGTFGTIFFVLVFLISLLFAIANKDDTPNLLKQATDKQAADKQATDKQATDKQAADKQAN